MTNLQLNLPYQPQPQTALSILFDSVLLHTYPPVQGRSKCEIPEAHQTNILLQKWNKSDKSQTSSPWCEKTRYLAQPQLESQVCKERTNAKEIPTSKERVNQIHLITKTQLSKVQRENEENQRWQTCQAE